MPKLGMQEIRRPQLINATMEAIDAVGLQATTVAMISNRAGVSTGIISHYFGGKYGLLEATMRSVLKQLSNNVQEQLQTVHVDDVRGRIEAIVGGNFNREQGDQKVVKTWLAFWAMSMHEPSLRRLQRVNDKRLLSHLRFELKRILPKAQAELVAAGIAALIDGVWLRGALSPDGIDAAAAQRIVDDYLTKYLPARRVASAAKTATTTTTTTTTTTSKATSKTPFNPKPTIRTQERQRWIVRRRSAQTCIV